MNYDDKVKNRLSRMEGQLRGIHRMMEEEKDCQDVITQLSAVRSGIERTIGLIVSENLVECVRAADGNEDQVNESIAEAVKLLVKSR
ncbi:cytoplasmic protein [Bacillus sp. FJAT-27916]|uniref:metal-sensitive transcriptional regulator n=1 Tax=Bacillaceae TaxID=186817 RepID=UPI000671040B|nr:metal-sensitive transcriptional regulator [Bacillus sp. FJAT-27916]KMY44004.1 cytoplasmic protein [Bacillus sp. FJAT-27916]